MIEEVHDEHFLWSRTLSDALLIDRLVALIAEDWQSTATLLAHLAEVDARKLYLPAACASMHAYCVQVLGLSEDAAYKRIQAARAGRRYPEIFAALADGRLHLTAVGMLAPHLTDDNAAELIAAAARRSKAELAVLIAARFPRPDLRPRLGPIAEQVALAHEQLAPAQVDAAPEPAVTWPRPLAPQRFGLALTIDQSTNDKLMRAQALLRHRVPSGDLAAVVDRALDALLVTLERERLAATAKPRVRRAGPTAEPATKAPRRQRIPAGMRRAVFARDGEQCTFVSAEGRRCNERGFLELDHVELVARGGENTVENLRVRCRAHNQHGATCALGADFMARKRAGRAETSSVVSEPVPPEGPPTPAADRDHARDEIETDAFRALRGLGFSDGESRRALAETARTEGAATEALEQRLRAALAALPGRKSSRCSEDRVPSTQWGWSAGDFAFESEDL